MNKFEPDDSADWFIIGCEYFKHKKGRGKCNSNDIVPDTLMLVFTKDEITKVFDEFTNKNGTPQRFWSFMSDENKKVQCYNRGSQTISNLEQYLIENRLHEIVASMK